MPSSSAIVFTFVNIDLNSLSVVVIVVWHRGELLVNADRGY